MVLDTLVSNLGLVNLIALLAIVVIGLPHGAADGAIAGHLGVCLYSETDCNGHHERK